MIRPPSGQRFMFHLEAGKIYSPSFPIFRVGRAFKRGNLELHPPFHLSLSFFLFFPLLLSAIFLPSLPTTFRLFFSFPLFYLVSFLSLSLSLFPSPLSFLFSINNFSIFLLSLLSLYQRAPFPLPHPLSYNSLTSRLSTRNPEAWSVLLYFNTRETFARVRFLGYVLSFNAYELHAQFSLLYLAEKIRNELTNQSIIH